MFGALLISLFGNILTLYKYPLGMKGEIKMQKMFFKKTAALILTIIMITGLMLFPAIVTATGTSYYVDSQSGDGL